MDHKSYLLTKERFSLFLRHISNTARYFKGAKIHGIRQGLDKRIEGMELRALWFSFSFSFLIRQFIAIIIGP